MRILFYNYYNPCRQMSIGESFVDFKKFRKEWDVDEEAVIIIPVTTFDLVGLDIRMVFREFGRNDKKYFLLIGDQKQIEFSLSQNDKFIQNIIDEIQFPINFDVFENLIENKIYAMMNKTKKV